MDNADDRMMVCDALANARIPFVVAGLSATRKDKRVRVSMRIVTAHLGVSSWRHAIPQVGQAGQDDYGSLELPEVLLNGCGLGNSIVEKGPRSNLARAKRRVPGLQW